MCLPQCLRVLPTFAALAVLIYREFNVPIVGLRTADETAVLFPVHSHLTDVSFESVFVIAKSKEVAHKIGRITVSVLSRHVDLVPRSAGDSTSINGSTRAGFLISAIEGKFPFRSRGDDGRSVKSARSPASVVSVKSIGRQSGRSDRITPLASEDDYGDCRIPTERVIGSGNKLLEPKLRVGGINFSTLADPGLSTTEDEDSETTREEVRASRYKPTVVALSPAELMRKASSPYMPPASGYLPGSARPESEQKTPRSPHSNGSSRREPPTSPLEVDPAAQVATKSDGDVMPASRRATISTTDTSPLEDNSLSTRTASTASYHTNTNGNGVPIDAATVKALSSLELEPSSPAPSASTPDTSCADSPLTHDAAAVEVRRRSAEMRDLRLRRLTLLRSFRRTPPPATLERHVVVCGTPSSYADFLANLSDVDEPIAPVVFVTPKDLTEKDYDAYTLYPNLYFVRGSPVSMRAFHDARMRFARSILIMAYCASESGLEETESELEQIDENMADVDAITTHRFISNACQSSVQHARLSVSAAPTPFVVVEMIKPSNSKFLVDRSGSLYDDTSAENEVRARELLRDVKSIDACLFSPLYASGHIHLPNVLDALLGSCSHHTLLIEMVTQLVTSGNRSQQHGPDQEPYATRRPPRLSQLPAPVRFHYRPYGFLVEHWLREEVRLLSVVDCVRRKRTHSFIRLPTVYRTSWRSACTAVSRRSTRRRMCSRTRAMTSSLRRTTSSLPSYERAFGY